MRNQKLDIVFFGIDAFSNVVLNSLINSPHKIKLVVSHFYHDSAYNQLKSTCTKNNIPLIRAEIINSPLVIAKVKEAKPDLGIIAHFERIIKNDILSVPKMGFINLHPSLLPYYRGLAPQHWPLINGETEVGITVHHVDEGTDTGDIILQRRYVISKDTYVAELHALWLKEYKTIMLEAIEKMLNGDPVKKQNHLKGSYYEKMKDEPYQLNKEWNVRTAYNWVRAMSMPYSGVLYGNTIVYKAHIMQEGESVDEDELILPFSDGCLVAEWYDELEINILNNE